MSDCGASRESASLPLGALLVDVADRGLLREDGRPVTIDIYTKRPIARHSSEHVLPSFLGGRLQKRGLIDKATNDTFGREIDADLAKALQAFRLPVDGLSDASKSASPLKVKGDDGAEYHVGRGGHVSPVPKRPKFERRPDGLHVEASFSGVDPMKALRAAVGARAKREGYNDGEVAKLVAGAVAIAKTQTSAPPKLNFSTDLYTGSCYRATAKVACNLLAYGYRELFVRREFDAIRAFVLSATPIQPWPVQPVVADVRAGGLGPLDHLVAVQTSEEGMVALVVYFGLLAHLVRLGDVPHGPALSMSYRVNQIRTHSAERDRRDDPADMAIGFPSFKQAAARTLDEVGRIARQAVRGAGARVEEIQHELHARGEPAEVRRRPTPG
jgi:hypothetical protein